AGGAPPREQGLGRRGAPIPSRAPGARSDAPGGPQAGEVAPEGQVPPARLLRAPEAASRFLGNGAAWPEEATATRPAVSAARPLRLRVLTGGGPGRHDGGGGEAPLKRGPPPPPPTLYIIYIR